MIYRLTRNVCTLLLAGAMLIGCAAAEQRPTVTHTVSAPLLSYERTGGIGGVDDRVEVFAGGVITVRHRGGTARRARLSQQRMGLLQHLLVAAHFERRVPGGPTGCSDCYVFRLSHGGQTLSFSQLAAPARVGGILRILTPLADHY